MLVLLGIVFLAVGISDFLIAAVIARRHAAADAGLGASEPPVVTTVLRRSGAVTAVIGAVLLVVGLVG